MSFRGLTPWLTFIPPRNPVPLTLLSRGAKQPFLPIPLFAQAWPTGLPCWSPWFGGCVMCCPDAQWVGMEPTGSLCRAAPSPPSLLNTSSWFPCDLSVHVALSTRARPMFDCNFPLCLLVHISGSEPLSRSQARPWTGAWGPCVHPGPMNCGEVGWWAAFT